MAKKLWNVYHTYDVDGGFGDPIGECDHVGTVEATDEEIDEFVKKWNQPEIYEHPFGDLYCHGIEVEEVIIKNIKEFEPYSKDPEDSFNLGIEWMKGNHGES